jgi:FKBP-type peptidyl-prolyl cis-trans isomerase FklB
MRGLGRVIAVLLAVFFCADEAALAAGPYDLTPEGNARFLADYAARKDVTVLPSGLMYRVLETGSGTSPVTRYDTVTVEYMGWLVNNKIFDRSRPQEPTTFVAGGVIAGWNEALMKMKAGDQWQIVVPANLGYGENGMGNIIPPNQTLVFLIRLIKVEYAP